MDRRHPRVRLGPDRRDCARTRGSSASARRRARRCRRSRRSSTASSRSSSSTRTRSGRSGSCTGSRSTRATGAAIAAYAIAGVEMALLDLKGKALGVPVAELLGGYTPRAVPVIGYLFIDEPEANAQKAADFVAAGHTRAEAQGRPRPRPGLRHDRGDPRPRRLRREDPDRREHELERPGRDQVDPGARAASTSSSSSSRCPDFDLAGLAQVRRSVSMPIAADESCTSLRSALELIKADACDVFVVYPSEAGGLTRALQIAALAAAARQVVRDRQLGRARRRDDRQRARRRGVASSFPFANDTHYPLQLHDVLTDAVEIEDGRITVPARTRSRRRARRGEHGDARRTRAPRVAVLRRHPGRRPECRPDPLSRQPEGRATCRKSRSAARDLLKRAGAIGAGAVAAGALAGRPARRVGKARCTAATPKKGGKVTWALEQDPGHIAPYGGDPHDDPHGAGADVRVAARVGQEPQPQAGDRESCEGRQLEDDRLHPPQGRQVPRTASESRPTTSSTRSTSSSNPPLPGSVSVLGQVPSIAGIEALSASTRRGCT